LSITGRNEKNGMLAAIGIRAARAKHGIYIESLTTEASGRLMGIVMDLKISRSGINDTIMPRLPKLLPERYVCKPSAKRATINVTSIRTHDEKYPRILINMFCIFYSTPLFVKSATAKSRKSTRIDSM